MMELLQFSLADMTPYSREIYLDLIGHFNQAVWPLQLVAILLTFLILYAGLRLRPTHLRWGVIGLGVAWLSSGMLFLRHYYASLNWAGEYFGYLFVLQGGFLLGAGWFIKVWEGTNQLWQDRVHQALLLFAMIGYPIMGLMMGRPLTQIELLALIPTPTLLATFALLSLASNRVRFGLLMIPLVWGGISFSFSWTLQMMEAFAILVGWVGGLSNFFSGLRMRGSLH